MILIILYIRLKLTCLLTHLSVSPLVTAPGPSSALPSLVHTTRGGCLARPPGDQSQLSVGAGLANSSAVLRLTWLGGHLAPEVQRVPGPGRGQARHHRHARLGHGQGRS